MKIKESQMKYTLISIIIFLLPFENLGHHICTDQNTDPKAEEILDAVAEKYLEHSSVEIEFSLNIEVAERPDRKEKGKIIQARDKFKVEMDDQNIYCDGSSLWYHFKADKEVQINDYEGDEDVGIISPRDLIKQYESGSYEYRLVDEISEKGDVLSQIEFRPKDEYSDYSKLRLSINLKSKAIIRVKAFGKDGSVLTLTIDKELFDKSYTSDFFVFNSDDFPDVRVEDLRLD